MLGSAEPCADEDDDGFCAVVDCDNANADVFAIPGEVANVTAEAIPGSRLLLFNDMGHDLPHTRHFEMAEAITTNAARSRVAADA